MRNTTIQYRVIWVEVIAGKHIQFSGRVHAQYKDAKDEADLKKHGHNYCYVKIEARPTSDKAWPRPWDERTITSK